jgi:hypothetical protein
MHFSYLDDLTKVKRTIQNIAKNSSSMAINEKRPSSEGLVNV